MLTKTKYSVSKELLQEVLSTMPSIDNKHAINEPTGNFFYDPWTIKSRYLGTAIDKLLKTLDVGPIGEARFITLSPGESYMAHADIDDRWHINLNGNYCYLVNLESGSLQKIACDLTWHDMDAGIIHSAVNLGSVPRLQLVVRHLLIPTSHQTIKVTITPSHDQFDYRYKFDNIVSPWLNASNKRGLLGNFQYTETTVKFNIASKLKKELDELLTEDFVVEYQ